ncbi:MAG: alkylation response protein AidB-like acyl-CoA dehydrogenase [Myxococcota bacterium]|jgi:alkylation response protein AidB-like acyl-CoA dehydrogenase
MNTFTDEHEELRATVRQFLADQSDEQAVRSQMASERGWDSDVWQKMAEQVGLAGLIVPEEHGGAGFGYVELCIVAEEMGRALLCAPYLSTAVMATSALLQCASASAQKDILPGIAAGTSIATLAYADTNGRWDINSVGMSAQEKDAGWVLDGTKYWVLDGHTANIVLVVARTSVGLELFEVAQDAAGLTSESIPALDLTRKLATLSFASTPARKISEGDQTEGLEHAMSLTLAALSAEQVGGAQWCLDTAVDYAKTRLQFGRPIGSYQAIKHKCADMLVDVEFAKSAAYNACFLAADCLESNEGWGELAEAAHLAKAFCSEAYFHAAAENIQIHGGMGFTWEHPAHLYFKRAKASELLFGDATHHREALADLLGI